MPELVLPGTRLGPLRPGLARELGLEATQVVAPATHDTASAVVGTPLEPGWLFLSSGTWSPLGLETAEAVITESASKHDFTNEGGAFGRNRFLKNVTGLWILESCRSEWAARGTALDHGALLEAVESAPPFEALIVPDDPRFLNPDRMTAALAEFLRETGQPVIRAPGHLARVILESLALRYSSVIDRLREVSGARFRGVHIVGGGSRNTFLNQATANAAGLPVRAGPVEATAIGNLVVQALADGRFRDIEEARDYLRETEPAHEYAPVDTGRWSEARDRFRELEHHD